MKNVVFTLALALVASRAAAEKITIYSDPPGATVYQNDQRMGTTPFTLKYEKPRDLSGRPACATTVPLRVRWLSGAESAPTALPLCPKDNTQFTFARPNVPGVEIDAQYVMQLEAQRDAKAAADRQARRDRRLLYLSRPDPLAYFYTPRPIVVAPQSSLHCTSILTGTIVNTNCAAW